MEKYYKIFNVNKNLLIFGNTELAEVSYFYFDKFSDYNIKGFVVDEEYFDSKNFWEKIIMSQVKLQTIILKMIIIYF